MKQTWLLMALFLGGCAAEYRTVYRLDPPASDTGHACVAACEHSQASCRGRAETGAAGNYQRCVEQSDSYYAQCQSSTTSMQEKKLCYRPVCAAAPSADDCETAYRSCFADCGGQIWSRQECVKNC